jgi:hypothetical protein
MRALRRRLAARVAFALLALLAELTGRELTMRLDRAFLVRPLATPTTPYYPFLLAGVRALAALVVGAAAWRIVRAHATAAAAERLLPTRARRPRPRLALSPRVWLWAFAATSLFYLAQTDAAGLPDGRFSLLAPWLHTYALPVFALLSLLLALAWTAVRDWTTEVERYAAVAVARASRLLGAAGPPARPGRAGDDRAPRRLFGLAFESRPPPLASA